MQSTKWQDMQEEKRQYVKLAAVFGLVFIIIFISFVYWSTHALPGWKMDSSAMAQRFEQDGGEEVTITAPAAAVRAGPV